MPIAEDHASWAALTVGDRLTVVKLAPDGSEAARYPGTIVARKDHGSWVVVRAIWTHRHIEVEGLTFSPGDVLAEWFSPHHDFNAFAVHAINGELRGWYANVTLPARLDADASPPILAWQDLYLDVVALPDGTTTVCDEDELAASGLMQNDPRLYKRIVRARDEILARFARRTTPFADGPHPAT